MRPVYKTARVYQAGEGPAAEKRTQWKKTSWQEQVEPGLTKVANWSWGKVSPIDTLKIFPPSVLRGCCSFLYTSLPPPTVVRFESILQELQGHHHVLARRFLSLRLLTHLPQWREERPPPRSSGPLSFTSSSSSSVP